MLKNLKMLFNTNSLSVKDLVDHFACNDESPAIDLRDSVAEDAGSTARKNSPQTIIPENEEIIAPELKAQKGFKDDSVVMRPEAHLHNNASLQEDINSEFTEVHEPRAHGRIVKVPNRKKKIACFTIEFDKEKKLVDGLMREDSCSSTPCKANTKKSLKKVWKG